ncbi:T9SS C-terminal target domain-containing protein [Paraflavitalea soli]|uniref:T9SS C-terminal target domain-containing protein n=1 Tax=Paraflavitalea soli TaxID=2315862 RepID=A0A3B7N7N2_9BACT|nr:T9SS type A sorting domain-containing protein [Paraflavitalea soli]AXY77951.1 T9SS C-terminal target domain-containing protein [Paraflavitalea soli]
MKTFITSILLFMLMAGELAAHLPNGAWAPPTTPATNVTFSSIDGDRMAVQWIKGNGANRIVIARKDGAVTATPQNGINYNASATMGAGNEIAPGEFIVFNGTGNSFTLTGLTANNTYHVAVFEYNGTGATIEYLASNPARNSHATLSAPTIQPTLPVLSNIIGHSMSLGWKKGNGSGRVVIAREGAAVNVNPTDLVNYTANSSFGSGSQIGNGNYVVYEGTGESVAIDNLKPSTTYYFSIFEYSGSQGFVYATTNPASISGTTLPRPTVPASAFSFTTVEGDRLGISMQKGNGAGRIIIAKQGGPVTAVPEEGVAYTGNTTFGLGQEIKPGEFILSSGLSNSYNVLGLTPGTTYHFAVYEFDGSGTGTAYLTATGLTASQSTVSAPTQAASNISFSNLQSSAVTIQWQNGNGAKRLVVVRRTDPVNALPVDLKTYSGSAGFGSGATIGGGYSVYSNNGNTVTVSGLSGGTTYHVAIFEYNGSTQPVYITTGYPTASFSTSQAPTQAATNMQFTNLEGNKMKVTWQPGNGNRRLVIARAGEAVSFKPTDNTNYTASPLLGSGQQVAPGEYVVYNNGGSNDVTVSNLVPGVTYHFAVFECNNISGGNYYLTNAYLAGSQGTISAPTTNSTALSFNNINGSSLSLAWVKGNGGNRLVLAKAGSAVDATPADLSSYTGNASFGTGAQLGTGNYVVYNNSGNTATITNLEPGITYHFKVFEYNGSSAPVYLTAGALTGSQTTLERPSVASSDLNYQGTEGNKMTVKWTIGNGVRRILIGRQGAPVSARPQEGVTYTGNTVFGSGQEIAPGEFVLNNNIFPEAAITNLLPNTVYHFAVFEYDGSGVNTRYLTSSFAAGSQATIGQPTVQAKTVLFSSIASNSINVNWTNGNGASRMVIARKGAPVSITPQDLQMYSNNASFGTPSTLVGPEHYCVFKGTASNVTVTNLTPGTTYYFAVFEYNGFSGPVHNTSLTAVNSATTLGPPTAPASTITFSNAGVGTALTLSWSNGSGQKRLVLVKEGTAVDALPADNVSYSANTFFGSGDQLGNGNYAVHSGTGDNVTITNLLPGKSYHVAVFEYNQFATGPLYLVNNPARASFNGFMLPVKLLSFSGTITSDKAVLTWETSAEINSKQFNIERSADGSQYTTIGSVAASGNSDLVKTYTFEDRNALAVGYYRLRMVDADGRSELSKVIKLENRSSGQVSLHVYPTRVSTSVNVSVNSSQQERISIQVLDMNGRLVKREQRDVVKGVNVITLQVAGLTKGIYIVHGAVGGEPFSERFVKE